MSDVNAIRDVADPATLVARIHAGEATAEELLIERYRRGVGIIIGRMVRDHFAAEDLSQETFRLTLEKIRRGDVRDPERLSGFVCGIARNLAYAHLRGARPSESLDVAAERDAGDDPLGRVLEHERNAAVRQVLAELPSPRDHEILRRFYLEEEEKETICADLDLSSLHFNRVLHRARQRFKELYQRGRGAIRAVDAHSDDDEPR